MFFPPGSTEDIVTSLIKNWEKEVSHKLDPGEWRTVDVDTYRCSTMPSACQAVVVHAFVCPGGQPALDQPAYYY